jgi:hypothetical protein
MINFLKRVAQGAAPGQKIVIAADGMKLGFFQPNEHLVRLGTTVHQVTDGKEPVLLRIKADCFQGALQRAESAMSVADREIASMRIQGKTRDRGIFKPGHSRCPEIEALSASASAA